MAGGEACDSPKWGGSQHCFVHLEPFGVSASNLVVALEHELVHVQRKVSFGELSGHFSLRQGNGTMPLFHPGEEVRVIYDIPRRAARLLCPPCA